MDVGTLKKQIKNKELDSFYVFIGDEYKVQDIYIAKIGEVLNRPIQRIDSVVEIYGKTKSLFSTPKIFVCRDDKDFIKTEKAWSTLDTILGENMLIFMWTSVDKRTKFYKHFEDNLVLFDLLSAELLNKYILKEVKLSPKEFDTLRYICSDNYGHMLIEVDKIKTYSAISKLNHNDAFNLLVDNGIINTPPQDAIFDFVDAVIYRNPQKAFKLLRECNKIEEPALRLITVLYTNFRKVLQVQSCTSSNVSESTGLTAWEVKYTKEKIGYWSVGELVYILKLLREIEKGIKIGTIEEQFAMDYFMTSIF